MQTFRRWFGLRCAAFRNAPSGLARSAGPTRESRAATGARWSALVICALVSAACSSSVDVRGLNADEMFARGQLELEAENWATAATIFEQFSFEHPTHPLAERARFHLGQAYFGRGEYLTASSEFLRLVQDYPAGEFSDDARFMVCRAYEELSPKVPLDQEYTRGAIEHCDALAQFYPTSEFADSARITRDRLREKLADKELYRADFYVRAKAYDSAIVYLEGLLEDFPRSNAAPAALIRLVRIYRTLGYAEEREEAEERLLREFPDSPEAAEIGPPAEPGQVAPDEAAAGGSGGRDRVGG